MKLNDIICGDAIGEMKKLPSNSMDLIFADPPYWMRTTGVLNRVEGTKYAGCDEEWDNRFVSNDDYNQFTLEWLTECKRLLKADGSFWVIGGMQCIYTIGAIMQSLGFWFINDVIWHKKNPTPNFRGTRLNNSHETLIWATKTSKSRYQFNYKTAKELNTDTVEMTDFVHGVRKQLASVWRIGICQGNERLKGPDGAKLHATQKPEELLRRIIAISSLPEDLVFDPFGGTMTTAAVAKQMGRNYLTIEKDPIYCEYGSHRLDAIIPTVGDLELAKYDEKPVRVTMKEMIAKERFFVGEPFYLKNGIVGANLTRDGKLCRDDTIYDMHTCAAVAQGSKASRLNGFDVWYVKRDGVLVSIDDVRNDYRAALQSR